MYMTGLFFEAEGEWNDAYISYKDALKGYQAYETAFDLQTPRMLIIDLARLAQRLGYEDEVAEYTERYQLELEEIQPTSGGELVVFVESGFVPRKHQVEFSVPILKDEGKWEVWTVSGAGPFIAITTRTCTSAGTWITGLGCALPEYREVPSQVAGVRLRAGDQSALAATAEDLDAIAQRTFAQKFDTILLRARRSQLGQVPSVQEH